MRPCKKAGKTICAIPGGSSTIIANRWTGCVREGLFERIEKIFDAFGWDVVRVKYGQLAARGL